MPLPFSLDHLPVELAQTVAQAWQRFDEACAAHGDASLLAAAATRDELPRVWAGSDFVSGVCIRAPQLLADLITGGELDRRGCGAELLGRIERELAGCRDQDDLDARLRTIRRREMVRLAWRDLCGAGDLDETMEGVSALAEGCIAGALDYHHRRLSERFGAPRDERGEAVGMVVLGLGKLGGGELNYSSDIDLIFAYDGAGETDGAGDDGRRIDNQEYFIKLGRKMVASLAQVTADGFVFRTDMRLRPNGESGPLALSFAAMEYYYQTHGRDWERYALIKARTVGGDHASGARLQQLLAPFVYRKYIDFGAFDSMREMKRLIEREVQKKGMQDDVKLGRGGIREIEFLVQSHQLIRGGRNRALQTQSLKQALRALVEAGVFDETQRAELLEDYRFLRNTEHRLQMAADRQTQRLPDAPEHRLRLAWSMGFDGWEPYLQQLNRHRERVHQAFGGILWPSAGEPSGSGEPSRASPDDALTDLWQGVLDEAAAARALTAAGFADPCAMTSLLEQFRNGRLYRVFSGIERDRIDRLIPLALRQAGSRDNAEQAVTAFISVVESIGRRSVYLSLLIENPLALAQLLSLCAASPWISRHIGTHPVVMDELLSPLVDVRACGSDEVGEELERRLAQVEADDLEARMNALREFNHAQILRVASADALGVLEAGDVCRALSQLARVILRRVFDDALALVGDKLGAPGRPASAGVIAYGKFAGGELGYHSDLDIVVCYDPDSGRRQNGETGDDNNTEVGYYYSRVGQRLIQLLTTRTHAGQLYELDMRLRPSGNSGTLVTSLAGFAEYQLSDAWTWEHQALVRATAVLGDDDFIERFEQIRAQVLCKPRDDAGLRRDIVAMKTKMTAANSQSSEGWCDLKLDPGGIVDIEFLVQYLVLREADNHPEIVRPRTTDATIEALQQAGIVSDEAGLQLRRTYQTYLRKSLDLKLMDRPLRVAHGEFAEARESVKALWDATFND